MDPDHLRRLSGEERRKERRDGIRLALIGAAFAACGVFLWVVGEAWMGPMGVAFGAMGLIMGIVMASGSTSPAARIATIVACAAFAVAGALSLVGGIVDPGAWGWRGGGTGILAGSLCLAFFGPGTVLLIVKEVRRRRRERGERE